MTPDNPPLPQGKGFLLTFICVGVFTVYLDSTIVNVALPAIQHDLSSTITNCIDDQRVRARRRMSSAHRRYSAGASS